MEQIKGNVSVGRDEFWDFMAKVNSIQGELDGDLDAIHFMINDLPQEVEDGHDNRDWIIGHLVQAVREQIEKLGELETTFGHKVTDLEKAQGCPPVV